jgi:isoaspartyl peptidase/L-asparaginase-like protein (Ntn-hydrolase superfamily)
MSATTAAGQRGLGLLDTLIEGLAACEEDPSLILVGRGSIPNADGEIELDASLMDGSDLSAGAVCAVRNICPVIRLANLVRVKTPHLMLAGDQAVRFALENGFEKRSLMTEEIVRKYDAWRDYRETEFTHIEHAVPHHGDTVTMLGCESGRVAAASSTSGWPWKRPGRVGDSPIIGAGIYADNEAGCAGATGAGEELWRGVASFRAVEAMRRGLSPQDACDFVINEMLRRQPGAAKHPCVVFAMNTQGEYGAAVTRDPFELWVWKDGEIEMKVFAPKLKP